MSESLNHKDPFVQYAAKNIPPFPLVVGILKKIRRPPSIPTEDLLAEGLFGYTTGLVKAYGRRKENRIEELRGYLGIRARGAMEDFIRQNDPVARTRRRIANPTARKQFAAPEFLPFKENLHHPPADSVEETMLQHIDDQRKFAEVQRLLTEINASSRDRGIFLRHHMRGESFSEIATRFGMHDSRARQIVMGINRMLLQSLNENSEGQKTTSPHASKTHSEYSSPV